MRHGISKLCLPIMLVLGFGVVANAADPLLDTYKAASVPADIWTGGYLGIHGGKVWSKGGIKLNDTSGTLIPLDVQNGLFFLEEKALRGTFAGGLTAGYNQQFGKFVFGVEADVTNLALKVKHNRSRIDPNPMAPFFGQETLSEYTTEFGILSTLRLRAGINFNKTMVYLTTGLAGAEVKNSFSIAIPGLAYQSPDWSKSGIAYGYAVGAGLEHKLSDKVSIKVEGIFVDLKDRVVNGRDPVTFPGEFISYRFENKAMITRMGLSYAF